MLSQEQVVLVVVDVQGRLAQAMHEKEALFRNLQRIIRGGQILGLPILWCEQNPAGLGPTIPEIAGLLAGQNPTVKMSFSCCGSEPFRQALAATNRKQVLLIGIEAHVCIYLTAADLVESSYEVQVVADAVASRAPENKQIGLARIRAVGASVTCTETALFEMLRSADDPKFKVIVKLLK